MTDDVHAKWLEFSFWMHRLDGDLEPYVLLLVRQELRLGAFLLELGRVCVQRINGALALFDRYMPVDEF